MSSYLTLVHALSALHAGTGQGSGIIDMPIAREKATGLPYLPGSSLKGTLRTHCDPDKRVQIFGSEDTDSANNSAGTVQISDQRLLLLPVRSLAGTFAWVTSPYVLRRLARDLAALGIKQDLPGIPDVKPDLKEGWVVEDENICQLIAVPNGKKIYLEEFDLVAQPDALVTKWANWLGHLLFPEKKEHTEWQGELQGRLCIVHDDLLNFYLRTATEITARIHLKEDSKTVMDGGLWYEEALPTETVLSGLALATPRPGKISTAEIEKELREIIAMPLQLGGKSTVGRGLCRVRLNSLKGGQSNANS
jgi:CRISPR-associated protein Cmr4